MAKAKRPPLDTMLGGHSAFIAALADTFAEPGDFTIRHSDEMLILTTENGTQIRAFAREIIYEEPDVHKS